MSDPYLTLGLEEDADDAAVETAYLDGIKRFPPERDAHRFEALRRAYETLRTHRDRLAYALFDTSPPEPADLLDKAYLDGVKGASATDAGTEDESVPDLFTLLAEVAALKNKNEVKLESRNLKSALDEFRGLYAALREANIRLADEQARCREQAHLLEQQTQRELLLDLLDLRDRLKAGHDQAVRFRPGRLGGRSAVRFVASMAEGIAMNLRRLDETLARRGVRPLAALGQPFDPHTMRAAELADDPTQAKGLVVGELRKGFHYQDQLLRSAEVVVNRPEGE